MAVRGFCRLFRNNSIFTKNEAVFTSTLLFRNKTTTSAKNPTEVYFKDDVQASLKRITGFELDKVFKFRKTNEFVMPDYRTVTAEELQEMEKEMYEMAEEFLQMPPYLAMLKSEEHKVISDDVGIAGHETHPIVFTDISVGVPHQERLLLVRTPEGTLRHAVMAERDRYLHVYYPRDGKMYHMPHIFENEDALERLLSDGQYQYILDRACVQFEPYEPMYIQISHRTYEKVNSEKDYDKLRSTRHFGPMSFYLAHHKKMEGLVADMLQRDLLNDAVDMVQIHLLLHPGSKSIEKCQNSNDPINILQMYLDHDSKFPEVAQLALQTYMDSKKKSKTKSAQ